MAAWCERWNIKINEIKTRAIYFTHRNRPPVSPLTLNGRNIPFVNSVKYLGVIFDKRMTWRLHIQMIEAKAFRTFITIYIWPLLWSSGQISWLHIRRPGFDFRYYQKKKVVGLEHGPLSLVSTTEQLLGRKVATSVYKADNTAIETRHADHVAPSIRKSWQLLRRQAAVARPV
jgi:hypothetical protein